MTNEGIELEIYSYSAPTGTKLGTVIARREPKGLEEIGSVGGGTFLISRNDRQVVANPNLLKSRNIAKIRVDGTVVAAFMLGEREPITIAEGEYAGEYYAVSGMGLKCWLDDAYVAPYGGFKTTSKDNRTFSFASEEGSWYVPANWINPFSSGVKVLNKGWNYGPDKWPDGATQAYWIWGTASSNSGAAVGDNYFRIKVPVATAGNYSFYIALDDCYAVYLDGERIAETDYDVGFWQEAKRLNFDLTVGTHIIGVKGTNIRGNAGMVAALFRTVDRVPPVSVGTFTVTIATDAVFTRTSHGLANNTKVYLTSTGTLPTGLSQNTDYYVRDSAANTFRLAKSQGGPAIDTSGSQSGTHTILRQEIPETQKIVTYSGMSTAGLTSTLATANATVTTKLNDYNALPAGDAAGNNTEKKQAAAKANALAAYRKAIQDRDAIQRELTASQAADSAGITWKVMPYPATAPGWTPGEILLTLISEASARGVANMSLISPNFTASTDSNGVAWTDRLEWSFGIGKDSLLTVAQKMEELVCDVWIDPVTYQLNVANQRGVDRSIYKYDVDGISVLSSPVQFKRGKNLTQASMKFKGKLKNALAMKTDRGWVSPVTDATSVGIYGRLESFIDTGASLDVSNKLATIIFKQRATEEEGASYNVYLPPTGKIPFVDFKVGDWVLAPNELDISVKRRIMSLSVTENTAGRPIYTIEFDTIFRENEDRINKLLQKLGGGGVGGSSSNAGGLGTTSPSAPVTLPGGGNEYGETIQLPDAPTDLEIFSIGQWSANGVTPYAEVNLSWSPVITNTDGSETVPAYYEVWGYPTLDGSLAAQIQGTVTQPTAVLQPYSPGVDWTFWVVAFNAPGRAGAPSATITHTMLGPTEPMVAPTAPVMTSNKGLIIMTWDGLMTGAVPPPAQFRYIYAEISPNGTTGWTRVGPALNRDNRSMSLAGYTVGTTQWGRFTAVDGVGVASPASATASVVVTGVALGDLDASIGAAIDAAEEAAIQAREQSNMLSDNSFELNTAEFWTLGSGVTNVTTSPRTGARHLRLPATTVAREGFRYNRPIPCQPGDSFYIRIYVDPQSVPPTDDGIVIAVNYGATTAMSSSADVSPSGALSGAGYLMISGEWTVPAGVNYFAPKVKIADTGNTVVYHVDDIRLLKMTGTPEIVTGSIISDKIAASAILAEHIAADSIDASKIQAGAITAAKIQANAITANEIAAAAITANELAAGAVTTSHIAADVGQNLDISSNGSINLIAGDIAATQADVDANTQNLETMQTYYAFGPTGAVISSPGNVFSLALRSDKIEMLENGLTVSYWNNSQMYVTQLIAQKLTMGNHQIEAYGSGTVIRDL